MNRILSSVLALAFCLSLGSVAGAKSKMASTGMHKGAVAGAMHGCKKGQKWVAPYMRSGKTVKGYCRNVK